MGPDTHERDHPWLAAYPEGRPHSLDREHDGGLSMLRSAVAAKPGDPALHYLDGTLTWTDLDRGSDALAALLLSRGFAPGERLAVCVQNDPAFVIGLLAAWKAGGVAALVSPMSRTRELDAILRDCEPAALLILDDLYEDVARGVLAGAAHSVHTVVTVSPLDGQHSDDPRLFDGLDRRRPGDTLDLGAVISTGLTPHGEVGAATAPDDVAVLAYTSGTTGRPKGAMLTHRNLAHSAQVYRDWHDLRPGEPVLALSPVFHVTGLVGGVLLSLLLGSPLVLTHRILPGVTLDAVRRWRPAFAIAAITAYIGLVDDGHATPDDFASFRVLASGGAPIEPATADRLEAALGHYIHNVYGQTETTSPSHAVPPGVRAPVDEGTRTLSVGLPVFDTVARIVDDAGAEVPAGEIGEIVTSGPQVSPGYWRNPEATAEGIPDGRLRTGDVGFMDAEGWFYVVDRRKDMINASGYKVWPREVEQVLADHPAVREVAVVGIPDDYRGESVKAFVALREGADVDEAALVRYCRDRMAAYKYPREIELVAHLPRTTTGKVLRRMLRG
ncbi:class I adenylate-forming enzyme family protein [Nocardioides sp. GXZ039]|uniref:class I adenylate-forming enzyme family protein n=1 Tax=Nocardioides sp. GXZ039 TaxID=3136018 RepID=UPI0030F38998